jgi:hypothetical protein
MQDYYLAMGDQVGAELFFMALARQQFPLQRQTGKYGLARAVLLFQSRHLTRFDRDFIQHYSLTFSDWLSFCVALYSSARSGVTVEKGYFTRADPTFMSDDQVNTAFSLISQTVCGVRDAYRAQREGRSPHLHGLLPTVLANEPLVDIGNGVFVIVHAGFVVDRAADGLYDLCKGRPGFQTAFGRAFEEYVGTLLAQTEGLEILTESDLVPLVSSLVCDYAAYSARDDTLLLVECKAVEYTPMLITENSIRTTNSTQKVAEGLQQVSSACGDARAGLFDSRLPRASSAKLAGLVITYGHIYLCNGQLYRRILGETISADAHDPSVLSRFDWPAQVLSIRELELLVAALGSGARLPEILSEPVGQTLRVHGDWAGLLAEKYAPQEASIPLLGQVADRLFDDIIARLRPPQST